MFRWHPTEKYCLPSQSRVDLALVLQVFQLFQLLFILATHVVQLLQPHVLLPILPLIHQDV